MGSTHRMMLLAAALGAAVLSQPALSADAPDAAPAAPAAGAPSGPQGDTWESISKLPDWSGPWQLDRFRNPGTEPTMQIPLNKEFMAKLTKLRGLRQSVNQNGDGVDIASGSYHCLPRGMPKLMTINGRVYEFMYTPKLVTILPQNNEVRYIYTDGRGHPDPKKPYWNGHSTGHWENGDTLVVDTANLPAGTELFYGFPGGKAQHIIERIHVTGKDKMEIINTIDDPTAFVSPWTYSATYTRDRSFPLLEDICLQNNRDLDPSTGKQYLDLTPPSDPNAAPPPPN